MLTTPFDNFKRYFIYILGFVLVLVVYFWLSSPLVMTVTGVGEVSVPAENAVLTFTLISTKDNPNDALSDVKSNVTRIKDSLKSFGVGDSDVYESQAVVVPASTVSAGASGFQATINVGLKINSIDNIDTLTTSLYGLGAIIVSQPQLSVQDSQVVDSQAYDLALKDAKSKANKIALKNFKLIKRVVLIQESQTPVTTTVTKQASDVDSAELNIDKNTGLIKFSKVLSVSYKMW